MSKKTIMTTSKAAEALGITPRRIQQLLKAGRIKGADKPGRDWIIPAFDGKPVIEPPTGRQVLERRLGADTWEPASIRGKKFSRAEHRKLKEGGTIETDEGVFRRVDWRERKKR